MSILKTLEKSSTKERAKTFWKRLEAWVTDSRSKYRGDPFYRTEWNVITLQIIFTIVILALVLLSFDYLYKGVAETLLQGILGNVQGQTSLSTEEIISSVKEVKLEQVIFILVVSAIITTIFGYIITRIALIPARKALTSQKRFINDIAHELRTPLSVIKTNSEVILMNDNLDNDVKSVIKSNIEELDRTAEIINNSMRLSLLMNPERINFTDVDLGEIVDASVEKLKTIAQKKKIHINIKKSGPRNIWGNVTALEQITVNIIKNSINYCPVNGNINVILRPDYQGNISLVVQDNGPGIPQADLFHIFEPFYRADKSRNRRLGSSGLGLTIVSELVRLHSGKVTVKSAPNRGTTVIILFPFSKNNTFSIERRKMSEVSIDYLDKNK